MSISQIGFKFFAGAALIAAAQFASAQQFSGGMPAGWTGAGSYGTSATDGVVGLAPGGGTRYGYVSTFGGTSNVSPFNFGLEMNGSYLRSNTFAASAGQSLGFSFNYVTSDGAGYSDYAWARLLNAGDLSQVAVLFTARTTESGNSVPGFGMPAVDATLTPSNVTIAGGTGWSPLGDSSGQCWGTGCGHSGWVDASYTIAGAGSYVLEFGVVNWSDEAFDSGLAFDGITVGGQSITTPVPEPDTYAMMLAGLGLIGGVARRRRKPG